MEINGKKVLVTGGNRGIGLALAKEFNKQGAFVYIGTRLIDESLKSEFSYLDKVSFTQMDLGSRESIDEFLKSAPEIDILVNNAGQLTGGLLENQNLDEIYSMLQVNIAGMIHLTKGILPSFIKKGSGKIINNSSISGVMFLPCASTYAAAKAGVVGFTECLASELKGTGVSSLLLITPGIKTRMFDEVVELYGNHLDVSLMGPLCAENYAAKVINAVKKDKYTLSLGGSTGLMVWFARHFPNIFRLLAKANFKR